MKTVLFSAFVLFSIACDSEIYPNPKLPRNNCDTRSECTTGIKPDPRLPRKTCHTREECMARVKRNMATQKERQDASYQLDFDEEGLMGVTLTGRLGIKTAPGMVMPFGGEEAEIGF